VGAAVLLWNVVGKAEHLFLVGVVPLHGDLHRDAVLLTDGVEDVGVKDDLGTIDVFDETLYAACVGKILLLAVTLIDQPDLHAIVEKGQFAQALSQDVVVVFDVAEGGNRGEKVHFCAAFLGGADGLEWLDGDAIAKFHRVLLAIPADGQAQPLRERVHHRNANPVKAA
jgi:hypothetical protein